MTHISRLAGGIGIRSWRLLRTGAIGLAAALLVSLPLTEVAYAAEVCGPDGRVPMKMIGEGGGDSPGQQPDLLIDKPCTIDTAKPYFYATVNIVNGGSLNFIEPADANSRIDFWASSIIVENKGALNAGESDPYGTRGGVLTIYIYGKDQSAGKNPAVQPGQGALCYTKADSNKNIGPCGIPLNQWTDNGKSYYTGANALPGNVSDYFYQYGPLFGDDKCSNGKVWANGACPVVAQEVSEVGYFGYKVLAVSYGGKLVLRGYKGTQFDANVDANSRNTGLSWLRLAADLKKDDTSLTLSADPGGKWWIAGDNGTNVGGNIVGKINDKIVVTTTDYLPGHSEELTITNVTGTTVTFTPAIKWPHNGTPFKFKTRLGEAETRLRDAGLDGSLIDNGAETRAAVALLTRSIRIVSGGDNPGQTFADAGNVAANCVRGAQVPDCYSFGAHTVFRQGFQQIQIQGAELLDMGQGGKKGHYPIHFHKTRLVPEATFVKDSVTNHSMTRWFAIHSTQGITLQRNIGFKSIGHGFYLEDGTETENNFYSNLGIFSRAAVDNAQNPRKIPGILAADGDFLPNQKNVVTPIPPEAFPYRSDYDHPSVFWITNGWNNFIGNMAAGAGTCGAAYWLVPAWNADHPDVLSKDNTEFGYHMKWSWPTAVPPIKPSFAALQKNAAYVGSTPLKSFFGNYATSTMNSFQVVGNTTLCQGVVGWLDPAKNTPNHLTAIPSFAPAPQAPDSIENETYYPHVDSSGSRIATKCPLSGGKYDCSLFTSGQVAKCSNTPTGNPVNDPLDYCAVTVLDHYTSSFHWAEKNLAAIWLRPQWYLVDNSVLTDVQNSGITFVTSGTYDRSAVIEGDWAVARAGLFVGNNQATGDPPNPFTSNKGPFSNGITGSLTCEGGTSPRTYCLSSAEGISMPLTGFGVNQRLFNIYDGPAYEEANAYFDITKSPCADCMYANEPGVRKDDQNLCYLPNAAIGWKQPNGFFYPPAFHSDNLFFDNVEIRHYVIDALFTPNTYLTALDKVKAQYCKPVGDPDFTPNFFQGYTDIDRQTELNDDDGTLTGLTNSVLPETGTISVNPVEFFSAPVETAECLSNLGVTADKACPVNSVPQPTSTPPTAKTSPYDYVTTVVYPECAVGTTGPPDNKPAEGRCGADADTQVVGDRFSKLIGRSGTWSKECSNEACYGVPLYRQFLTGDNIGTKTREWSTWFANDCKTDPTTAKCRFPFVRMGGQSTYQRSTMTVNHGTYFLDTTVTRDTQWHDETFTNIEPCVPPLTGPCQPRSVNVFENNNTYYMFFLYAKRGTEQTYQIYVGDRFNLAKDLKAVRANLDLMPIQSFKEVTWPSAWKKNYNDTVACPPPSDNPTAKPNCGILQVTVNFKDQTDIDLKPTNGLCLPHTFCKADSDSCTCALDETVDPLVKANSNFVAACQKACSKWAVKDLDFPKTGPLGFSFKLSNFVPDGKGQAHRPAPKSFPTTASTSNPDWTTQFSRTSKLPEKTSGKCYYAKIPGSADCPVQ